MTKLTALILGMALIAPPSLAAPATGEPIKIGDISMYSKAPEYTGPYKQGVDLAVAQINADGGINGRPLEIISRDSKLDPGEAVMLGKEMPTGWVSVGFPSDEIKDEGYLKFKKAFEAKHKDPIKFYTLTGYNTIQAIAAALRAAGSTEPEKLRDALEATPFQTPYGEMRFRKIDHQANVPFWVGVSGLKDGKGALVNWHVENAADHAPTDAWILEQRAKATEGKKGE